MRFCRRRQAADEVARARAEFHHNYLDYVSQLNDIHGKRKLDLLSMVPPRVAGVPCWWGSGGSPFCGRGPRRGRTLASQLLEHLYAQQTYFHQGYDYINDNHTYMSELNGTEQALPWASVCRRLRLTEPVVGEFCFRASSLPRRAGSGTPQRCLREPSAGSTG